MNVITNRHALCTYGQLQFAEAMLTPPSPHYLMQRKRFKKQTKCIRKNAAGGKKWTSIQWSTGMFSSCPSFTQSPQPWWMPNVCLFVVFTLPPKLAVQTVLSNQKAIAAWNNHLNAGLRSHSFLPPRPVIHKMAARTTFQSDGSAWFGDGIRWWPKECKRAGGD